MTIDIKATASERLGEYEIIEYFQPSAKFDTITERDTIYVMGPRGSGKSMILNYLSLPVQLERYKNSSPIPYDKTYLGVYVRCKEHYFGAMRENLDDDEKPTSLWQQKFTHIFNLTVCEVLLRDLVKMKNNPLIKITSEEEKICCQEICRMINLETKDDFSNVRNLVKSDMRNISKKTDSDFFTVSSFLSELQDVLIEQIKDLKGKWLVVLLDEYDELTFHQKQIVNEIISIRKPIFKIGTLPPELLTTRQAEGKEMHLISDFSVIDIGTKNLTPNSTESYNIKDFFAKMANRRLAPFGLKIEKLLDNENKPATDDPEDIIYGGLDDFVLLSSGNARIFLRLLNVLFSISTPLNRPIPYKIQDQSVKKFAIQLMDGIEFLPNISPYVFRSFLLKMGLLFRNYLKETKRPYLQIGIKDPENLPQYAIDIISLAIEKNYLMPPSTERYSREGGKLFSLTLNNSLLPYFDLPLKTHQVCELTSNEIVKMIDRRSSITKTDIVLNGVIESASEIKETLDPFFDVIDEIIDHAKNGELVIFVGSGLSTELGYPTGRELAEKIASHFKVDYVGEDLSTIVERVLTKRKRGDLIKFIRKILEESKTKESGSYKKLAELGFDQIFTTNWDSSIEEEFKKKHPQTEKIVIDGHLSLAGNRKPLIFKIHGDFEHPDVFVITNEDSMKVEETRPAIINALKDSLFRKHFLFLGYSMEDLDFKTILYLIRKIQGNLPLTSYAASIIGTDEKLQVLKEKGIIPLSIKGSVLINAIYKGVKKT